MLTIDRTQRRHYSDGTRRYYGVSQVIQVLTGLDPGRYGEAAAQRGSDIHQMIAIDLLGGTPDVPETYRGYWESYTHWRDALEPHQVLHVEDPAVSRDRQYPFAGTPDLLLATADDRVLIDFKSGAPAPWHHVQIQAYSYLDGYAADYLLLVYLHADGRPATVVRVRRDYEHGAAFNAALSILIWRERHGISTSEISTTNHP